MTLPKLPAWAWAVMAIAPLPLLFLFPQPPLPVLLAVIVAVVVWTMVCVGLYWRGLDEAARSAQMTAWMWGGSLGAAIALLAFLFPPVQAALIGWAENMAGYHAARAQAAGKAPALDDASLTLWTGMMFVVLAQVAGFALVWTGWWISRRSRGSDKPRKGQHG